MARPLFFLKTNLNFAGCCKYLLRMVDNYKKLKALLEQNKQWPLKYMFKFIVPNNHGKVDLVKSYMPEHGQLSFKHTQNLKYVSVTCVAEMETPNEIIVVTRNAMKVEGVIAL